MNRREEILCSLLRFELWGEPFTQEASPQELADVLRIAKQQTVFGLVFNAVVTNQLKLDKQVLFKALAIQKRIKQQNERINAEMADFFRQLDSHQLEYVVMKGQTIGTLYPHPEMRMSGDVDFLIKDNYDDVRNQLASWFDISLPSLSIYEKEASFKRNEVLFEIHTYLITFGSTKNSNYWDNIISKSWNEKAYIDIQGTKIRVLPLTIDIIYVFLHLFFHFIREGVGLRQFCDWAVLQNYYYQEMDREQMEEILVKLDILKAYQAFGSIAVHELGLPADKFPFELTAKDEQRGRKIFKDVIKGGNFGKLNHKEKHAGLKFKLETALVAIRNSIKYYPLAPRDFRNYLIRLIKGNLFLIFKK